jgi:hypothetical protein
MAGPKYGEHSIGWPGYGGHSIAGVSTSLAGKHSNGRPSVMGSWYWLALCIVESAVARTQLTGRALAFFIPGILNRNKVYTF